MNQTEVAAYLDRLGLEQDPERGEDFLGRLIRAHLEKIPFENLDVYDFDRVPELEEEALCEKIIRNRRGGVCFELNTLFLALLKALGYQVYPVAGRVLWNKTVLPPLTHMGIVAEEKGKRYYCDVGYGGPGPKGLVRLEPGEQTVDGEAFRIQMEGEEIHIDRLHHGEWKAILQLWDHPFRKEDFRVLNFYCARCQEILFVRTRVVNLCTLTGSKSLMDDELTVRENGTVRTKRYAGYEELERGLREEFGIQTSFGRP